MLFIILVIWPFSKWILRNFMQTICKIRTVNRWYSTENDQQSWEQFTMNDMNVSSNANNKLECVWTENRNFVKENRILSTWSTLKFIVVELKENNATQLIWNHQTNSSNISQWMRFECRIHTEATSKCDLKKNNNWNYLHFMITQSQLAHHQF